MQTPIDTQSPKSRQMVPPFQQSSLPPLGDEPMTRRPDPSPHNNFDLQNQDSIEESKSTPVQTLPQRD